MTNPGSHLHHMECHDTYCFVTSPEESFLRFPTGSNGA